MFDGCFKLVMTEVKQRRSTSLFIMLFLLLLGGFCLFYCLKLGEVWVVDFGI